MNELELQRSVTRIALNASGSSGFALAGSGAIREHGFINRLSEDVDLFTSNIDEGIFAAAVDRVKTALESNFDAVELIRRSSRFARIQVLTDAGHHVDIDMGVDWREAEPVTLDVGPVLSIQDAVGNKVSALFSRAAPRDFYDVDAIRASAYYSDAQLIAAAHERDAGFTVGMFASQLDRVNHLSVDDLDAYGVDAPALAALQARFTAWARSLRPDGDGVR